MKILIYAPIFPPVIGGPATQCFHLCKALLARGQQPVVVTIGEAFTRSAPDGYTVYRYPFAYTSTPLDKLIRWFLFPFFLLYALTKEKPDILHCNSPTVNSFIAGAMGKTLGIPTVLKFAGEWVWETLSSVELRTADFEKLHRESLLARALWQIERAGLKLFDAIWAPSEFRARNVERILGHRRRVRVIPNALLMPSGGLRLMKEHEPFVVVSASRFVPHKRIPFTIKAFAAVKKPGARLVLIGAGEKAQEEEARQTAARLSLVSQVTFTGRLFGEELYEHFKTASVYVSSSLEEGFPNVFVEAMRFGLPIISTDVGGCAELVEHGVNGFLYDPRDESALTGYLQTLADDYALRNRMAQAAFERSAQYDLSTVIDDFLAMYRSILAEKENA